MTIETIIKQYDFNLEYSKALVQDLSDDQMIAYENYFEDFLKEQPRKVQDKIFKIIEAIETLERVPANYLKAMEGTEGLYEARIQLASNIWRVFCFFDKGKLVVINGILND